MATVADPVLARTAATQLVATLAAKGFIAYFAGGCVRDELLGLAPTDFDVATDARPNQVTTIFSRARLVGEKFGVVIVPIHVHPGAPVEYIEVATFRSDGTYTDSRRPDSIVFSTPQDDAARRDFTINAIFLNPLAAPTGTPAIIDYTGGVSDLKAKVIRAVGDPHARLAEDHLRALRAVRFAARFGFTIEPATAQAITQHAAELKGISTQRIGEEIRRMFLRVGPARAAAAQLLVALGLDLPVLGETTLQWTSDPHQAARQNTTRLHRVDIDGAYSDVATSGIPAPQQTGLGSMLAAWALDRHPVLLTNPADHAAPISRYRRALNLSNDDRDELAGVLNLTARLATNWSDASIAQRKRLASSRWIAHGLAMLHADPASAPIAQSIAADIGTLARHGPGINPPLILGGDHLTEHGWKPGPTFKRVLDAVRDAQLEASISTLDEALTLAERIRADVEGTPERPV